MLVNPACLDRESLLAEFAEEFPVLWWARTAIRCLAEFCVLTDCLCLVKRARSRTGNDPRVISCWSQFAAFNTWRLGGGYKHIGDILGTYGTYYLDTALTVCDLVDLLGQHLAHLRKWLAELT